VDQLAFYTESKDYISGCGYNQPLYFTTPDNCKYILICAKLRYLESFQVEVGDKPSAYEEYGFTLDVSSYPETLYTLNDAWIHWKNNEKFPIGFLGDSTTDGVGTTGWDKETNGHATQDTNNGGWGSVDYINQNTYSYKLEQLIKEETKNNNARVYNIGYSGTHLEWAIPKLEELFGGIYSDVKMVGLVHGINDRTLQPTAKEYSDKFTANLETVVKFLFNKGIQPFMVTTQAVMEPGTNDATNYPLRTSEDINSIANKCKIKIANKYNLEVLDMNTFGDLVLTYSKYDLRTLCRDKIHFGDVGHSLEAGYLFSKVCPRVIFVEDTRNDIILSFTSQKIRTDVSSNDIAFCNPFVDGFKSKAQFTKGDTDDWVVQDFWIMNTSKGRYNLNVYTPSVNGVSYVRLDGVTTIISSTEQLVGELEIGLHHVQFLSGKTYSVSCYGFKMKPVD
jgi:lysophospholipase L1-like esterase